MKILIITFTKGINPGTFMQALGVKTAFQKAFLTQQSIFLIFQTLNKITVYKLPQKEACPPFSYRNYMQQSD